MQYSNRQKGTVLLLVMGGVICFTSLIAMSTNSGVAWSLIILLAGVSFLFHSLNIRVNDQVIQWSFGPGFWKKSISLGAINSVKLIASPWYNGLGIRLISSGWLYIVSGTTAVELELKNGSKISLGTNDPENLINAIRSHLTS